MRVQKLQHRNSMAKGAPTPASFKPGQSGNPNGRPPKGYSITEWFQNMLASNPDVKDAIGKSIMKKALEGDPAAQRLVWNYMDGMPQQKTDITSKGEGIVPLLVRFLGEETHEDTPSDGDTK